MFKKTRDVKRSRGAKAIYAREEHLAQAKKDIKVPFMLKPGVYFIMVVLACISDFYSIEAFQDTILRTDETVAYFLVGALIACLDVIAPITLPSLLETHFNQKKLKLIALLSIAISIGILMVLNLTQKIVGVNVMLLSADETPVVGIGLKLVTQVLYALVPLITTVALTCISLAHDNYKIYRKFRYLILAETDVEAQYNEVSARAERDVKKLKLEDDIKFITTIDKIKAAVDKLFQTARMILAEGKSPEEADRIIHSRPAVYDTPYDKAIAKNPIKRVTFEQDEEPEEITRTMIEED